MTEVKEMDKDLFVTNLLNKVKSFDTLGLFLSSNYYLKDDVKKAKKILKDLFILAKDDEVMTALCYRTAFLLSIKTKDYAKAEKALNLYRKHLLKSGTTISFNDSLYLFDRLKKSSVNDEIEQEIVLENSDGDIYLNNVIIEEINSCLNMTKKDIDKKFNDIKDDLLKRGEIASYLECWDKRINYLEDISIFKECNKLLDDNCDIKIITGLLDIIAKSSMAKKYNFTFNYLKNKTKYKTKEIDKKIRKYCQEIVESNMKLTFEHSLDIIRRAYFDTNYPEFLFDEIKILKQLNRRSDVVENIYLKTGYLNVLRVLEENKEKYQSYLDELNTCLGVTTSGSGGNNNYQMPKSFDMDWENLDV